MSTEALRDLNMLPGSERINGSSSKGIITKACSENTNEDSEKQQRKNSVALASTPIGEEENKSSEVVVGVTEVEYIDSEHLNDLVDVDGSLSTLLGELDSKDWVLVCEALNNVRRFSIFHKEAMLETLDNVISLIVKSLKNPRSAVCKTAVMASEDIFKAYGDLIIDTIDPLLVQLLLKSSQDKRFVCEAAVRALVAMTTWVSPTLLLPKLQPHLKHKNPRIRAKASMCFCQSVPRLGPEGIKDFGVDKLIQIAASQLSDQLPESREAARTLLLELRTIFEESLLPSPPEESENPAICSWEQFCESKLPTLVAQAVLRATTSTTTTTTTRQQLPPITRENLTLSS